MKENFGQGINWESIIRGVLQKFDIPSREDIRELNYRLDRLEGLIYQRRAGGEKAGKTKEGRPKSASDVVLEIMENYPGGTDFKTIKEACGYNDKKLRNIIYRLDKIGKIEKVKRGVYRKL